MNMSDMAADWTNETTAERLARALSTLHAVGIIHDHERNMFRQRLRAIERVRVVASKEVPPAKRSVCTKCDDTGYKDHAGFAMDPCDHGAPEGFAA